MAEILPIRRKSVNQSISQSIILALFSLAPIGIRLKVLSKCPPNSRERPRAPLTSRERPRAPLTSREKPQVPLTLLVRGHVSTWLLVRCHVSHWLFSWEATFPPDSSRERPRVHMTSREMPRVPKILMRRHVSLWLLVKGHWAGRSSGCKPCKQQLRYGKINIPPCSKAVSAEQRPKFSSPLPAMVAWRHWTSEIFSNGTK